MRCSNDILFQRAYIYGYLNVYFGDALLKPSNKSYKTYKLQKLSSYLNLSKELTQFLIKVSGLIKFVELFLSYVILVYRFLLLLARKLFTVKQELINKTLLLGSNEVKTMQLLDAAKIKQDNIIVITVPFIDSKIYKGLNQKKLLSLIDTQDIIKSFYLSVQTIYIIYKKYHKRDFLFRSYSSFEFYLSAFFTLKSDKSNSFIYTSLNTRWSYLHGMISNYTVFLQHGLVSLDGFFMKKIGNVDFAYYINEEQKEVCETVLFYNKPDFNYLESIKYSLYPEKDKVNILLICNNIFHDKETEIISLIGNNSAVRLFVKPHPHDRNLFLYNDLQKEYGFVILGQTDFPKVDLVISYHSTLAIEYSAMGVNVVYHDTENFNLRKEIADNIQIPCQFNEYFKR